MSAVFLTEMVVVRPPSSDDAEKIACYQHLNRYHFANAGPTPPEEYCTEGFWRLRIQQLEEEAKAGRSMTWVLLPKSEESHIIGDITLSQIVCGPFQACYLGFKMDRDCCGRGWMREATEAVIRYAFNELGLHRIMANYQPDNLRSARLLEKLGFEREGFAKKYLLIGGEWRDHVLTALVRPD